MINMKDIRNTVKITHKPSGICIELNKGTQIQNRDEIAKRFKCIHGLEFEYGKDWIIDTYR